MRSGQAVLPVLRVKHGPEPLRTLTPREMEALMHACRGLENKELAWEMGITHATAKNLFRTIYLKLQVDNRTSAVMHAIRQGWYKL